MLRFFVLTTILSILKSTLGGVLILSPKPTEISSLKPFDEDAFNYLKDSYKKAKFVSFKINSEQIPKECEHVLESKNSAYISTVSYLPDNLIVLDGFEKRTCEEIKKQIHLMDLDHKKNVVYLIFHDAIRIKRDVDSSSSTTNSPSTTSTSTTTEETSASTTKIPEKPFPKERVYVNPDEPVLYYAEGKALLYSSRAPVLRVQNDTVYELGPTSVVRVDERDTYLRLICTIPVDNGKISLRFRFPKLNEYWYLKTVEVEDMELKTYNLSTQEVVAPLTFSYRCGGETVFQDVNGTASLTLYDMQVQPRTSIRRFSDAYNCVPFMTGPIWSGIFVSSILGIGLIIGLNALGSIKTMDKFDNSKTKQLTITVIGE